MQGYDPIPDTDPLPATLPRSGLYDVADVDVRPWLARLATWWVLAAGAALLLGALALALHGATLAPAPGGHVALGVLASVVGALGALVLYVGTEGRRVARQSGRGGPVRVDRAGVLSVVAAVIWAVLVALRSGDLLAGEATRLDWLSLVLYGLLIGSALGQLALARLARPRPGARPRPR